MTASPLFAQFFPHDFLAGLPWFAWIAIIGILSGAVSKVAKRLIVHRERMAMIQMGMHPDRPDAAEPSCSKPWVPETSEL